MSLFYVQEQHNLVITYKLNPRVVESSEKGEVSTRKLICLSDRTVELGKASGIFDGTHRWLKSMEVFSRTVQRILVESAQLAVDVVRRNFSAVANAHCQTVRIRWAKGWGDGACSILRDPYINYL